MDVRAHPTTSRGCLPGDHENTPFGCPASRLPSSPHLLCVGGEDHHLRIPFLTAVRRHGFRITALGSGKASAFDAAGIPYSGFDLARFIGPQADWQSIRQILRCTYRQAARCSTDLRHQAEHPGATCLGRVARDPGDTNDQRNGMGLFSQYTDCAAAAPCPTPSAQACGTSCGSDSISECRGSYILSDS